MSSGGTAGKDWVTSAMSDDTMVADLLVHLRFHTTAPPPPPPKKSAWSPLPDWTVRRPRSKYRPHRASPTTPLSWSAAATHSGGSGEESSRPPPFKLSDAARSKVNGDSEKTASKRPRKKTLPELREEEKLLVKERRELKRAITALRMNLDKQRATNERFKRMKLELLPHADKARISTPGESVPGQFQENRATACVPYTMPQLLLSNDITVQRSDHKFSLPDLNMPLDEPSSDIICSVS